MFLEYTLVPHATYPKPIYEAVEAVKYVLEDLHRPASQIMLAGDSAGGNMCLGVLSQIMHPSPDFPSLNLGEGEKLKAIVETILPLSDATHGQELSERGHTRGKIVLRVI